MPLQHASISPVGSCNWAACTRSFVDPLSWLVSRSREPAWAWALPLAWLLSNIGVKLPWIRSDCSGTPMTSMKRIRVPLPFLNPDAIHNCSGSDPDVGRKSHYVTFGPEAAFDQTVRQGGFRQLVSDCPYWPSMKAVQQLHPMRGLLPLEQTVAQSGKKPIYNEMGRNSVMKLIGSQSRTLGRLHCLAWPPSAFLAPYKKAIPDQGNHSSD